MGSVTGSDITRRLSRKLSGTEPSCSAGGMRDAGSTPGQDDPLGKGTATHPSFLAWIIPRTEEPGRLQPTGSQRVGHD